MARKKKKRKSSSSSATEIPVPAFPTARPEQEVFEDLGRLCASPGFIHALAYLCFRENTVAIGETLTAEDLLPRHSPDRLIRNELTTLAGLLVKGPLNFVVPDAATMERYIDSATALLEELHHSMMEPWKAGLTPTSLASGDRSIRHRERSSRADLLFG